MKPLQMYICINKDLVVCDRKKRAHTHTHTVVLTSFSDIECCARSSLLDMSLDLTSQKMSAILAWDVNMTVAFMVVSVFVSLNLCLPSSRVYICWKLHQSEKCANTEHNGSDPVLKRESKKNTKNAFYSVDLNCGRNIFIECHSVSVALSSVPNVPIFILFLFYVMHSLDLAQMAP